MNHTESPTPCPVTANEMVGHLKGGSPYWVTVNEMADHLKVNPSTVRRWIAQGVLTAVRIGKTTLRVDFNSLQVQTIGRAA